MSPWHLKQVSNETANDVLVVGHQDVSVVPNHNVLLLSPYDVSCKFQMKHMVTLLWYVSTMSPSNIVVTVSTFSSYFVMSSVW